MKKALIFRGGWDGHEPVLVSERFARLLEKNGIHADIFDGTECLCDKEKLTEYELIVPCVTMGEISRECEQNVSYAVSAGECPGKVLRLLFKQRDPSGHAVVIRTPVADVHLCLAAVPGDYVHLFGPAVILSSKHPDMFHQIEMHIIVLPLCVILIVSHFLLLPDEVFLLFLMVIDRAFDVS